MKKTLRPGLLARIIIAMILGIGCGFILPLWADRIFATFNSIFSSFLGFTIPLLILGFVAPAIAELGRKAGPMLGCTLLIAYLMTFGAGQLAYWTSASLFPSLIEAGSYGSSAAQGTAPQAFFSIPMEPLMSVTSSLILAFVLGFGCTVSRNSTGALKKVLCDFRDVIRFVIERIIIPLLPLYIFGIFLSMTVEGAVAPVLTTFIKIIAVIFVLHIALLLIQYGIASLFSGKNPLRCLRIMLPAYATALGTQSSAATIPVTLERSIAMGVSRDTAGFVIPLCATIHLSGSTLKIVSCAVALMIVRGMPFDAAMFAGFIAMLGITMVAAPGVPGGAIMAAVGLLSSMLGFSETDVAMMIALYIAMDSFGTACNITGDGAIALIIDKLFGKKQHQDPRDAVAES